MDDRIDASATACSRRAVHAPHVGAPMMGLDATFLSREADALGLGFEFRFVQAVPAGGVWTRSAVWTRSGMWPRSAKKFH